METRKKSGPVKRKAVAAKGKGGKKATKSAEQRVLASYVIKPTGSMQSKQLASQPMSPFTGLGYTVKLTHEKPIIMDGLIDGIKDGLLRFLGIKPQHSHKDEF